MRFPECPQAQELNVLFPSFEVVEVADPILVASKCAYVGCWGASGEDGGSYQPRYQTCTKGVSELLPRSEGVVSVSGVSEWEREYWQYNSHSQHPKLVSLFALRSKQRAFDLISEYELGVT